MHRERLATETIFDSPNHLPLYAFTALLTLLVGADLGPLLTGWLNQNGWELPVWDRSILGYRFALWAAILGGARVLYGSIDSLLDGRFGADLALAIACIAAILVGEPLVAAEVVLIGLIGECLEAVVFERTQRSVGRLVELFPKRCWRLRDGTEERVFVDELQVGDTVVVKPGGKVPVDGIIRQGTSSVDVKALTGESVPVDKRPGDAVLAGSINQLGALTIEATHLAKDTVAGRVIELTGRALQEKATLERIADRYARLFLPIVLALAAATFLVSLLAYMGPFRPETERLRLGSAIRVSIYPVLSVLVVACPCALVLATPAAVIATLGRLAGTGVLVRRVAAFERIAQVNVVAFDKTGTLTEGKLEVVDRYPLQGTSPDELLTLAATAEQGSEHPIARAILSAAKSAQLSLRPIKRLEAYPGGGILAIGQTGTILVGSRRWLQERGVPIPESFSRILQQMDESGQTAVLIAGEKVLLGALGLSDRLRPEAAGVVADLQQLGVREIAMLSGDRQAVADAIVRQLPPGVRVHAELWPQQKVEQIDRLAAETEPNQPPRTVMMIGDGINDAPALAKASIGIAVGGTDLVVESGDLLMMSEPLRPLPFLIRLSRQMLRIMRQNILIFGFGVNFVGIALIAWIWPMLAWSPEWFERGPLMAAIYHQLGSLLVLLNSMRLLMFERRMLPEAIPATRIRQTIERWSSQGTNFGDWLHDRLHDWPRSLAMLGSIGLGVWLVSGIVIIQPGEAGIVKRFGEVVTVLPPGLSMRYPWPIEQLDRIAIDRIQIVEIGFRSPEMLGRSATTMFDRSSAAGAELTWASVHQAGTQRIPEESVLITGDGGLVELLATVRFTIHDPLQFRQASTDPEGMIRAQTESILRESIASRAFLEILTVERSAIQDEVTKKLQRVCDRIVEGGLGIQLDGVTLHDLHPPQEVVPAYHEVARAIQSRDRSLNDAKAESIRTRGKALESSMSLTRAAEATSFERVTDATAVRDAFLAWKQSRTTIPRAEDIAGLLQAMSGPDAGIAPGIRWMGWQIHREQQRQIRGQLTLFRLGSEALVRVLQRRDKLLIDAMQIPGKRTLWILDPASPNLGGIPAPLPGPPAIPAMVIPSDSTTIRPNP
ncbi:cation-translocating P-type ATPase family protein [Tuwongella immobilis]|uniref:Band 7 domain-containing protein n=1 Tax=Tuwongella immobilis TaxID=692036 RepID=A0A6C2YNY3_9BACT|nr:cation-translocating P-type ATPase family protein [Tuwongella immobilis]VIP03146.1 heavy metal translocating p-type atpase : Copper/silver-translocating P-type ATPase OS=Singulisphaera acidiphila (strain ATCC BAA-1392 / DSM 18658 / VKM B-2454 / MOB10) GN=Sinac_7086 PE=3 SV=1: E1-E2_ATPase: Hydrolase: Band_7 [Tuwongella immobilis]VTS03525.1 heavy metal translocating p-type atpase : Copper/silver-translocating P-type ATPase OS=Singulisphaera acidiphila (strain ATCC BAA-1392 / DSM 18658 / VKM B-2